MRFEWKRDLRRILIICIAAALSAFNLNTFVRAAGLFPGGFSGLSLLIREIFEKYLHVTLPYAPLNLLFNALPAVIGLKFIGKKFTLFSCVFVVLSSVLVDVIPAARLTDNTLLLCLFGAIVGGFTSSIVLNADATTGGTDFISIALSERKGVDAFGYILAANVVMLCIAGLLLGWERSMYSIIYQYIATQVVRLMFTRYQKQTLFIVTDRPQPVFEIIRDTTHHAATMFRGEGLYEQSERTMLYSVVSRSEAQRVVQKVRQVDPHAFINSIRTQSLTGRFYQRPND